MFSRKSLGLSLFVLASAIALAGCGRRGPLELPPGTTSPPQAASKVDPSSQSNPTRPSLARDTTGINPGDSDQLAPKTQIIVPKTPFFLDPLL